ncbi:MAG: hypothetical protein ISR83_09485 [Candidatus Marinimicrobia bacterium]|nr:hypothetical protein [Candidatus Neomarinimicrobiota bacterium]
MKQIYILLFISLSYSQNIQVHSKYKLSFNLPVFGTFNTTYNQTIAPGLFKMDEKTEASRFYARWLMNEEVGEIIMKDLNHIIKYNKEDKEYWFESPDDYFKEPDTTSQKSYSYSIGASSDDSDNSKLNVTRTGGKEIETLHGFRTKKWITTLTFPKNKMIFEEWYVDQLPLMTLSDSLEKNIKTNLHPLRESYNVDHSEFSSNILLSEMDSLTTLDPIDGYNVKMNLLIYEGKKTPNVTISFELLELYAEPIDTSNFIVPNDYEKIEID